MFELVSTLERERATIAFWTRFSSIAMTAAVQTCSSILTLQPHLSSFHPSIPNPVFRAIKSFYHSVSISQVPHLLPQPLASKNIFLPLTVHTSSTSTCLGEGYHTCGRGEGLHMHTSLETRGSTPFTPVIELGVGLPASCESFDCEQL